MSAQTLTHNTGRSYWAGRERRRARRRARIARRMSPELRSSIRDEVDRRRRLYVKQVAALEQAPPIATEGQ